MWWLTIFLASFAAAQTQCRVLAMSGGGSFGSYEAGAFAQLVNTLPAQEVAYNALAGVSAGSLNSFMVAQYAQGDEKAAVAQLQTVYSSFNGSSTVYVDWPGGIITGLELERGLYDDTPLKRMLSKFYSGQIKRNITIGTCNLNTGHFDNYNETVGNNNMLEATLCSASIPSFFPFQSFMGGNYADGGTIFSIDIDSAVNRCYQVTGDYSKITIDMISDHHFALNSTDTDLKSYEVLERVNEIHAYDKGMYELYWALQAYPTVNFRYYIMPSVLLGKVALNFTNAALTFNWNLGLNDTAYVIKNNIYAQDVVNNWVASNGGIIKGGKTIHI